MKAAEAEVYVTKMQLVMDAGDEPETPVEQATTAFYEATKAAEEAAAAALAAHANPVLVLTGNGKRTRETLESSVATFQDLADYADFKLTM